MNVSYEAPKPEVKVFYNTDTVNKKMLEQILLGMEEEGIPYETVAKSRNSAIVLGYNAAQASHLGVGIGIDERLVLHFIKLKESQPLFNIPLTMEEETLRALGANAARLVKRMPFKDLKTSRG